MTLGEKSFKMIMKRQKEIFNRLKKTSQIQAYSLMFIADSRAGLKAAS